MFLRPGRAAEVIEERGGQIVQTRAAIEQEHLAQDPGEGPARLRIEIAPADEHAGHAGHGVGDARGAKHLLGQGHALVVPEGPQVGQAAQEIGQRDQVMPDLAIDPGGMHSTEGALRRAEDAHPRPHRPRPVGRALMRTVAQNGRHGGIRTAALALTLADHQRAGLGQRADQTGQSPPGRLLPVEAGPGAHAVTEAGERAPLRRRQLRGSIVARHVDRPLPGGLRSAGHYLCRRHPCGWEHCGGPHAWPPTRSASAARRHVWTCAMLVVNFAARSRPDKWMY